MYRGGEAPCKQEKFREKPPPFPMPWGLYKGKTLLLLVGKL